MNGRLTRAKMVRRLSTAPLFLISTGANALVTRKGAR